MRNRLGLATALAVLLAGSAMPAFATHEPPPAGCRQIRGAETVEDHDDDVFVCRQDVFFHKASTRLGNLVGPGLDTVPSWNTSRPTNTLQDGGAAWAPIAAYDALVGPDPNGRAIFRGTFTGPIDTLSFNVFLKAPIQEALGSSWPACLLVSIDGEPLYDNYSSGALGMPLKVAGNLRRIDGVFTNIYDAMLNASLDVSPTATHTIEFHATPWYFGDSHTALFYDAAEAASGLVFNLPPTAMAGHTKVDLAPPAE